MATNWDSNRLIPKSGWLRVLYLFGCSLGGAVWISVAWFRFGNFWAFVVFLLCVADLIADRPIAIEKPRPKTLIRLRYVLLIAMASVILWGWPSILLVPIACLSFSLVYLAKNGTMRLANAVAAVSYVITGSAFAGAFVLVPWHEKPGNFGYSFILFLAASFFIQPFTYWFCRKDRPRLCPHIAAKAQCSSQSSTDRNVVSVTFSTFLFSMIGCVIAVGGMLAGLDPALGTAGLILYAFIAAPIFLIGAVNRWMKPSNHKSFRATCEPHIKGERVGPHRWSVGRWTCLAALLAMFGAAGAVMILSRIGFVPGGPIVAWFLSLGAAVAVYFIVVYALKRLFVQLGVVSHEEAESFTSWSRRWPESWLERADKDNVEGDADRMSGKAAESETHVGEKQI